MDFQPETEETLKARYGAAVEQVYDVAGMRESFPTRKHVFDFFDGTRLIVLRVRYNFEITTHYSMSIQTQKDFRGMEEIIEYAVEHINTLRQEPIAGMTDIFLRDNIVHLVSHDFSVSLN